MIPRILAVIYDETYDLPKKSAAFTIFKSLIESDPNTADELSEKILNEQLDKYYLEEEEFEYFEEALKSKGMQDLALTYHDIGEACFR